jgi:hypothetical protein
MDERLLSSWWKVIYKVADELEKEGIPYSFDGSTSLFVHGIEFEMDDVDVMVQWDNFQKSYSIFRKYRPSLIEEGTFSHFHFFIDNLKVHIMSSESIIDLSNDSERVKIEKDGHVLWSKCIDFYRRHIPSDHPLAVLIYAFIEKRERGV